MGALRVMQIGNIHERRGRHVARAICASRGRYAVQGAEVGAGKLTVQRLEPNGLRVCNTITSVVKDNLVLVAIYD